MTAQKPRVRASTIVLLKEPRNITNKRKKSIKFLMTFCCMDGAVPCSAIIVNLPSAGNENKYRDPPPDIKYSESER